MSLYEMTAIQGLEDAVIGTGLRTTGREVLVYDAVEAQKILEREYGEGADIVEYLYSMGVDSLGDNAPLFVFLDDEIADELRRASKNRRNYLH